MIGMDFGAFLPLLIISAIWSAIVHAVCNHPRQREEMYARIIGWH